MTLPHSLRRRFIYAIIGALLGAAFAAFEIGLGAAYRSDNLPIAIGAVVGGFVAATLLWPRAQRSGMRMALTGALVMLATIWICLFAVGFFSEREISSRQQGLGIWVGSFFGSL